MHVKAKQKMYYQRREYAPGDIYEMDDREAMEVDILCRLGKLELVKTELVKWDRVDEKPDPPSTSKALEAEEEGQPDKKRSYRRRDMRPEK